MAQVAHDGQAWLVNGRRVYLVCGQVDPLRVPADRWDATLRGLVDAGFNAVQVPVAWSAVEPEPGKFDFKGDRDLPGFVRRCGELGLWVWLMPGPYIDHGWDAGGLPAWLRRDAAILAGKAEYAVRIADERFLAACSRYLAAVMDRLGPMQVTAGERPGTAKNHTAAVNAPGRPAGGYRGEGGGPVLLVQVESAWLSHDEQQHARYHLELVRYLQEHGCTVPLTAANQLFQPVDGTVHTWNGAAELPLQARQLRTVQPAAPAMVTLTAATPALIDAEPETLDGETLFARFVGALSAGAMVNVAPFTAGQAFGFSTGRTVHAPAGNAGFFASLTYPDAPLSITGETSAAGRLLRRAARFASQFHHTLGSATPDATVAVRPTADTPHPLAVTHLRGNAGEAVFFVRHAADKTRQVDLLLPDGRPLRVDLGDDRAAWLLVNVNLQGVATLNATNLRPVAFLERELLVLYGPAGSDGVVVVNDVPLPVTVPTGRQPLIETHGPLKLAVLSDQQLDCTAFTHEGLVVGCEGLDDDGAPVGTPGWNVQTLVRPDGTTDVNKRRPARPRKHAALKPDDWHALDLDAYLAGEAQGYHAIERPASLATLGVDAGYGWYHLRTPGTGGNRTAKRTLFPNAADRLHVFRDGKLAALIGDGPGARSGAVSLPLDGALTVLADGLGRFADGQHVGNAVGLLEAPVQVAAVKLPAAAVATGPVPDPFTLSPYIVFRRRGQRGAGTTLTWKFTGSAAVVLRLEAVEEAGTVCVNGVPVARVGPWCGPRFERVIEPTDDGPMKRGRNAVTLHLDHVLDKVPASLRSRLQVFRVAGRPVQHASWSFAPFAPPEAGAYAPLQSRPAAGLPRWYRVMFETPAEPVALDVGKLTKGVVVLNGRVLGRYFAHTADGAFVPPKQPLPLPASWLRADGPNDLQLFDEHGADPRTAKLVAP